MELGTVIGTGGMRQGQGQMDRERGTVTVADKKEPGQSYRGRWIGTETQTQETRTGYRDRRTDMDIGARTEIRKGTEGQQQGQKKNNRGSGTGIESLEQRDKHRHTKRDRGTGTMHALLNFSPES